MISAGPISGVIISDFDPQFGTETEEGGVVPIPPRLHNLDCGFATIITHRLDGHLQ